MTGTVYGGQVKTLTKWAKENGYTFIQVSNVVRGVNRCNYGVGHEIAVKLGMKAKAARPSRAIKVVA